VNRLRSLAIEIKLRAAMRCPVKGSSPMMSLEVARGRTLRATLCEIEHGVFFATYPDAAPDSDYLATYQTGRSAADAKRQIERSAKALGYDTVVWGEGIVTPLYTPVFPPYAGPRPAASYPPPSHLIRLDA
ncbi:MAG TPA: hypothetical protein VGF36_06610, partial [Rhodopila sp.]